MTKMIMNIVKVSLLSLIALAFAAIPLVHAGSMMGAGGGTDAAMESETKSPDRPAEKATVKPTKPVVKAAAKTAAKTASKTGSKSGTTVIEPKATAERKSESKSATKAAPPAALDLTSAQQDKLLALLNEGTTVELAAISGIASTRAEAIVGARPFQKVHEVILVPGVGAATFDRILKHGKTLTRPAAKSAKS